MKYALVNTMCSADTCLGRVLSVHRSVETADRADTQLQHGVRLNNGRNSYLPTVIRAVKPAVRTGDWLYLADCLSDYSEDRP